MSIEVDGDLGELEVREMDELQVSGSSTAYNHIAENVSGRMAWTFCCSFRR
ncbi:hypothetical protein [Streptomyces monomycini]|uniref:hypothetical protein n=1 Tax=Streptomyces monomycini TaxID=371720 RepID=UPI001EECBE5F|nr:hypothetical protein [Streptomyces monomycini]